MRLFGLTGFPLSHSFSAAYFRKKFESESIPDAVYRLFPLENISLISQFVEENEELHGFNVTIPYKVAILPYLHQLSDEASAVGAVNCVKIHRSEQGIELTGYNTDVYGFRKSLSPLLKPWHIKALVLGTGGAAKAVSYTLEELGIDFTLVSRAKQTDATLLYTELTEEIISSHLLIINTTPAGMYPNTDICPDIPYRFLNDQHLLYDLIYNPSETLFLQMGRKAGASTANGLQMLALQAEKSWEIWNE